MTKLVSRPLLSQRMFPPWLSTISLAMASPSPAPPVREGRDPLFYMDRVERAASSR